MVMEAGEWMLVAWSLMTLKAGSFFWGEVVCSLGSLLSFGWGDCYARLWGTWLRAVLGLAWGTDSHLGDSRIAPPGIWMVVYPRCLNHSS
jgi:hypothetical protein